MKKMMTILALAMTMMTTAATKAGAMTYNQARTQALYLADKMAYELSLSADQHEAVYEINLDYLMAVNGRSSLYGRYWNRRNAALGSVLTAWQWNAYRAADYFYRPVAWVNNGFHWRIYDRYQPDRFYHSRPAAFTHYRGGRAADYYAHRRWSAPTPTRNMSGGHRQEPHMVAQRGFARTDSRHMGYDNGRSMQQGGNRNDRQMGQQRSDRRQQQATQGQRNDRGNNGARRFGNGQR